MRLAFKAEIQPTPTERQAFLQHAGNARWAYNWGLRRKMEAWAERKAALEAGTPKDEAPKVPSAIDLHRELNALKKMPAEDGGVPWMYEASKAAPQESLRDLDNAFQHFFRRVKNGENSGFPRFKSRHHSPCKFRLTGTIKATTKYVQLPSIGRVRLKPGEHGYIPTGKYSQVSVSERAGRWYIVVLGSDQPEARPTGEAVGLDAGVVVLATLSDGTTFKNARALRDAQHKLHRLQRELARKQKGSNNRKKAKLKVARAFATVSNVRLDALHKATTAITKRYGRVVIEDLNISGMTRSANGQGRSAKAGLNRVMLDAALSELRRQLEYKGKLYGCEIITVPPAYTSQQCSTCGHIEAANRTTQARFVCVSCGYTENADLNAAKNILEAGSCPDSKNACGGDVSPGRTYVLTAAPMKQESA